MLAGDPTDGGGMLKYVTPAQRAAAVETMMRNRGVADPAQAAHQENMHRAHAYAVRMLETFRRLAPYLGQGMTDALNGPGDPGAQYRNASGIFSQLAAQHGQQDPRIFLRQLLSGQMPQDMRPPMGGV